LRHTCARQLLNAGCRITSIQKFLGHKSLNTTLTYAHDQTMADDYFMDMSSVEKRMELMGEPEEPPETLQQNERGRILVLAEQSAQPEVSPQIRLALATQIRMVLTRSGFAVQAEQMLSDPSPPVYQ
jgi:hypothetical protein